MDDLGEPPTIFWKHPYRGLQQKRWFIFQSLIFSTFCTFLLLVSRVITLFSRVLVGLTPVATTWGCFWQRKESAKRDAALRPVREKLLLGESITGMFGFHTFHCYQCRSRNYFMKLLCFFSKNNWDFIRLFVTTIPLGLPNNIRLKKKTPQTHRQRCFVVHHQSARWFQGSLSEK